MDNYEQELELATRRAEGEPYIGPMPNDPEVVDPQRNEYVNRAYVAAQARAAAAEQARAARAAVVAAAQAAQAGNPGASAGDNEYHRRLNPDGTPCSVLDFTAKEVGEAGEVMAAKYLESVKYRIVERNYRCCKGEADLIAIDPCTKEVVLVEVKTRVDFTCDPDVVPELSVTEEKQRRYRDIALFYVGCHASVASVRFDVVSITIIDEHAARLRHLVGAFCWDEE